MHNIPYFSIKSTRGLWRWFRLRQHLMQVEFPLDYSCTNTSIGIITLFCILLTLWMVLSIVTGELSGWSVWW
jgi:hypothetical protein